MHTNTWGVKHFFIVLKVAMYTGTYTEADAVNGY